MKSIATDNWGRKWAIYPEQGDTVYTGECLIARGAKADPRVTLDRDDPRAGRIAVWGENHLALVYAVILVDGTPRELLLRDWTGYPWVRVPLDAETRSAGGT